MTDYTTPNADILVHLARLALTGRAQDIQTLLRKSVPRLRRVDEKLADELVRLIGLQPSMASPLRDAGAGMVPLDADSQLALVRHEFPVVIDDEPVFDLEVQTRLHQVLDERRQVEKLQRFGLAPTRSMLFVGPPGVGKTLSARWLSARLGLPLLVLDLATVMSSYLGKTGANIRAALDYAKSIPCVLLLDEFDAIAKKRGDDADVGELKRLVNVLLQEIDDWPSSSLLIAATNHGELLDPAIWRRFDELVRFNRPDQNTRMKMLERLFEGDRAIQPWLPVLADIWIDVSHSDIVRTTQWIKRRAALNEGDVIGPLMQRIGDRLKAGKPEVRIRAAATLEAAGWSDRQISAVIGISRDTLRSKRRAVAD